MYASLKIEARKGCISWMPCSPPVLLYLQSGQTTGCSSRAYACPSFPQDTVNDIKAELLKDKFHVQNLYEVRLSCLLACTCVRMCMCALHAYLCTCARSLLSFVVQKRSKKRRSNICFAQSHTLQSLKVARETSISDASSQEVDLEVRA